MLASVNKRGPLESLRQLVTSLLFPTTTGKSASFGKWLGPDWTTFREGQSWMKSRRSLEGAEGLWRVDNGIYDLREFAARHPGGRQWIELTKGTDITEMFYSHHITDPPRQLMTKFYVREARTTRNSPFTFRPDGFYETLRRRVRDQVKDSPLGPSLKSGLFADTLLLLTIIASIATAHTSDFRLAIVAGFLLSATTICAHNFFHQRDNWRMFYFQISGLSVAGWRISHAMSHHMFPNSPHDLEVAMFEPWLQWSVHSKNYFWRFVSWLYSPIVYTVIFPVSVILRWSVTGLEGAPELLPLVLPVSMALSGAAIRWTLLWWVAIVLVGSFFFGLIGLNAGHHHPELFHDGDEVRTDEPMDWGVFQMLTVRDRVEIRDNIFGLTLFGDHCLHHMFPTLDHSILARLYPELQQTCDEFGLQLSGCSFWDAVKGQFKQLARVHKLSLSSKYR